MHPDPPSPWKVNVRDMNIPVFRAKSFDDQYLDELKTLRDPNYKPKDEMMEIAVSKYFDAAYINMIQSVYMGNPYADDPEL